MPIMTPLWTQTGVYGTVQAHQPIDIPDNIANKLMKNGNWVMGLSDRAKAEAALAEAVEPDLKDAKATKGKTAP